MMSPGPLPEHVTTVLKKWSRLPRAQSIKFKSSSATPKVYQGPVLILPPDQEKPTPLSVSLPSGMDLLGPHSSQRSFRSPRLLGCWSLPRYPLDVPSPSTPLVGLTCPFLGENSLTHPNGTAHRAFLYSHIDLFSSAHQ